MADSKAGERGAQLPVTCPHTERGALVERTTCKAAAGRGAGGLWPSGREGRSQGLPEGRGRWGADPRHRRLKGRLMIRSYHQAVWRCGSLSRARLCDPVDRSLPGPSVHGALQDRTLRWGALPSSGGSSPPRGGTWSPAWQAESLPAEPPGKTR